ncbi:MAG: ribonuclease HI [Rothia sp. (in: high G+C Gram-positive bacteria)]|uniref:RNase H family protein n=1 Tax=Rothia sp. (in: high G+C Gram-positive bacteria) TaxID=1885016 RepID=UPI0026E0C1B0|nr:RNase H family protein [Rothia sp. (in: high G+C Gram-positive bacteria)]MDO5750514.1 ribonuclease HI [Rothia sp. (in: high G+C Gram-positive bacteria)]
MGITPAHFKKCTLTWCAPDYSTSYPAGYTAEGVAVIAVVEESQRANGYCYSASATMTYISREDGTREVISESPNLSTHKHCMLEPCENIHANLLGRAVLEAFEGIPEEYRRNLVTIAADRRQLKTLFRQHESLKTFLEYRAIERVLDPYDNHSLGEVHVRLAGTDAGEQLASYQQLVAETARQMLEAEQQEAPEDQLQDYEVFTDCSFRSTHNKKYTRGGRMGIAGVSEDGFYFHNHYDGVNIMTGELSAMLNAFFVFYNGTRRLVINTDSLGALTFVLRLAHHRRSFERWVSESVQDARVIEVMSRMTEAIRARRVIVKHVPGHTGHGLQESSDSVSKMHRHFPGQVVEKRHIPEFNQRCESIITALSGCTKAVRLPAPEWLYIRPSHVHMGNKLWR